MASDLILTPAQAQAVYSAMCALSSAQAHAQSLHIRFPAANEKEIGVDWNLYGIVVQFFPGDYQHFESPAAFAAGYGLDA